MPITLAMSHGEFSREVRAPGRSGSRRPLRWLAFLLLAAILTLPATADAQCGNGSCEAGESPCNCSADCFMIEDDGDGCCIFHPPRAP